MHNKKYNVTLLHTPASESITNKLATLFKISSDKAQLILKKESFVIKKETDLATAETCHKAIINIGANCRIDEFIKEDDTDLPAIEDIVSHKKVKKLIDITQPDIPPLHEEEVKLSLADGPAPTKPDTDTPVNDSDEKVFDDIQPEDLCPACGTIRASADSNCAQCGYDPKLSQQSKLKKRMVLAAIFITIIIIGAATVLPSLLQQQKQAQIEKDLVLVFDTRNKIAGFIQKTNFWPNQNIDANLKKEISNTSIKSIRVSENAVMNVTIRAEALDGEEQTLIFIPKRLKGRIVWNCLKGTLSENYRPNICQAHPLPE